VQVTGSVLVTGSVSTSQLQLVSGAAVGYYLVSKDTLGNAQWTSVSIGGGTTNHAALINLDYATSGHTGFESQANAQFVSGNLVTRINAVSSSVIREHSDLTDLDYASSGHTGFESQADFQFVSGNFVTRIINSTGSLTRDHAGLTNLSYATSGHTGFASPTINNQFATTQSFVGDVYITGSVRTGNMMANQAYSAWGMRGTLNNLALGTSGSSGWAVANENYAVLQSTDVTSGNLMAQYNRAVLPTNISGTIPTASGQYMAVYNSTEHNCSKNLTGSIIQLIGERTTVTFWSSSGSINQAAGLYVTVGAGLVAPASLTTGYGLYIDPVKNAATTNAYGLYIAGASDKNTIAGWIGVGSTTAPVDPLVVTGRTTLNGDLVVTGSVYNTAGVTVAGGSGLIVAGGARITSTVMQVTGSIVTTGGVDINGDPGLVVDGGGARITSVVMQVTGSIASTQGITSATTVTGTGGLTSGGGSGLVVAGGARITSVVMQVTGSIASTQGITSATTVTGTTGLTASGGAGLVVAGGARITSVVMQVTGSIATTQHVNIGGGLTATGSVYFQGSRVNDSKNITFENPVTGDNITWFRSPYALTVSEAAFVLYGGSSPAVTASIYQGTSRATGTLIGTNIVTSTTNPQIVRSFSSTAIPSGSVVWIAVSGSTGGATQFHGNLYF
jgi:hypothetical protein